MIRLAPLAIAVAAVSLSLAACETSMGHGDHYAYGYADGYYDDAYGPFYDGYWGPDSAFYYRNGPTGDYVRDSGNHFRRDNAQGYHTFHARGGQAPAMAAGATGAPASASAPDRRP